MPVHDVGSITSRCSGKEPALLPRLFSWRVDQTRQGRAAEIEPSSDGESTFYMTLYRLQLLRPSSDAVLHMSRIKYK